MSSPLTGETRLSQVLEALPGALDYVVGLNPHDFARLRNPVMRKYMGSRISLRRVAAMAGIPEAELLASLRQLADQTSSLPASETAPPPASPEQPPDWLRGVDRERLHWVDLLPIDDAQGDPFPPISLAVRQLEPGGVLAIRHRWEPQPFYDVWSKMDLAWYSQQAAPDEWHVFVHRPPRVAAFPVKPVVGAEVRQLPPGEVVPRVVALAQQLRSGQTLEVTGAPAEPLCAEVQERLGHGYVCRVEAAAKPAVRITAR